MDEVKEEFEFEISSVMEEEWQVEFNPENEGDPLQMQSPQDIQSLMSSSSAVQPENTASSYNPKPEVMDIEDQRTLPVIKPDPSFVVQPHILASYSFAAQDIITTSRVKSEEHIISEDQSVVAGASDGPGMPRCSNIEDDLLSIPRRCGVKGCNTFSVSKADNIAVFRLPNNLHKRKEWLERINRMDLLNKPSNSIHVCERHFNAADILDQAKGKMLKRTAVPIFYLPTEVNGLNVVVQASNTVYNVYCQTDYTNMEAKAVQVTFSELEGLTNDEMKKLISECKKRLKGIENGAHETQKRAFDNWCDRFLPARLAEIIKGQASLKFANKGNRYDTASKALGLNCFYTSQVAYEQISKDMRLPHIKTLRRLNVPISTEYNEEIMTALQIKVNNMSETEKYCSVIVDLIKIKASLSYRIKKDKIAGLHEVNGCQSLEAAQYAIVIIARGLLDSWSQPIAFALLSETKRHLQIFEWINVYLSKLLDIGLKIKTFIPTFKSDLLNEVELRNVSVEKPYFLVNGVKIYYIFDVPDLLLELRNMFIDHRFHFQNENGHGIANIKYVIDLVEKNLSLAPKLTKKHFIKSRANKVRYAAQLLSRSVATALDTKLDFGDQEDNGSGKDTVEFILLINNLFDILNSSSPKAQEFKKAFYGEKAQVDLLERCYSFFETLKIENECHNSAKQVTSKPLFSKGFQITIKAILLLFEDLKQEGHGHLFTRNLQLGASKKFFKTINMIVVPTSKIFINLFRGSFLTCILKPTKQNNCTSELSKFLLQLIERGEDAAQHDGTNQQVENFSNTPQAMLRSVTDTLVFFQELKVRLENNICDICNILLKGCLKHHNNCERLKSFVDSFNIAYRSCERCELPIQTEETISPMYFVSFVEIMEKEFCEAFDAIETVNNIGVAAYEKIKDIEFAPPCPCFPTNYFKALFVRMRIFMIVHYNSQVYRQISLNRQTVVNPKCLTTYV